MNPFFNMVIGQSDLDKQSALIGEMVEILRSGNTFTIEPTDKTSIAALTGLRNLLDEIAVQMDDPDDPDQLDNLEPFDMERAELVDYYKRVTGDSLDDVFGFSDWETIDGQTHVAASLGLLNG